jgi:hypothetical protein
VQSDKEIDIYDIADWLWTFKWLGLVLLVLGLAGSTYIWITSDARRSVQEITLTIFSGGNGLQTEEQIAEILGSTAVENGASLLSARATNPVIFSAIDLSSAQAALTAIAAMENLLLDQTRAWVNEITPLINDNPAAFESYTNVRSFLNGLDSGLFKLVTVENQEVQLSVSMARNLLPLIAATGLFLLIALGGSFANSWRNRRSAL